MQIAIYLCFDELFNCLIICINQFLEDKGESRNNNVSGLSDLCIYQGFISKEGKL